MDFLDLTLSTVESNLSLDEALLRAADAGECGEVIRIWELKQLAVVVGRASRIVDEVHWERCERMGIPVARRCSGGCAVVLGPGCLLYSMIFSLEARPYWRKVDRLHHDVRQRLLDGLRELGLKVVAAGTSDLAIFLDPPEQTLPRKISGNSVRFAKDYVLYHGTLLYSFELPWLTLLLKSPPRQPEYRRGRDHELFVANIFRKREELVAMLKRIWGADHPLLDWPRERTRSLLEQRYGRLKWHYER
ncbi:MAG: lipoate--protein ligase family protein [Thermogutta sp.]